MSRTRTALALVAVTAVTVLVPGSAAAESAGIRDGADATASLTDIRRVRVDHTDTEVVVRVTFPDLRRRAQAGLTVFFDSDPAAPGPERSVGLPLFSGSDYVMVRMRDWRFVGEPVECRYGASYRWGRDVVVLRADRGCFRGAEELRVGMRMRDAADSSHVVTDWLLGRRHFTRWLGQG